MRRAGKHLLHPFRPENQIFRARVYNFLKKESKAMKFLRQDGHSFCSNSVKYSRMIILWSTVSQNEMKIKSNVISNYHEIKCDIKAT